MRGTTSGKKRLSSSYRAMERNVLISFKCQELEALFQTKATWQRLLLAMKSLGRTPAAKRFLGFLPRITPTWEKSQQVCDV